MGDLYDDLIVGIHRPQTDLPSWKEEGKNIYVGSKAMKWVDRRPTAYWKGNPYVGSDVRTELLKCNISDQHDWGAEIFQQVSLTIRNMHLICKARLNFLLSAELVG